MGATLKEYAYRKIEIVGFSILYYRESRSKFQGLSDWCRAVRNCYCRSPAGSWHCVTIAAKFRSRPVFGSEFGTRLLPGLAMRWWC